MTAFALAAAPLGLALEQDLEGMVICTKLTILSMVGPFQSPK